MYALFHERATITQRLPSQTESSTPTDHDDNDIEANETSQAAIRE
jgi:hypothetical protein